MSIEIQFGDIFAVPLRNGVSYSAARRGSGVPMVNMKEIFAFDRISNEECELAPLTEKERLSYMLESWDLLFARQSLTFEGAGKCSLILPANGERTFESHLMRVRLNPAVANAPFYYYYFRSSQGRRNIETIIQQVAAAGIRGSDLARLKVPFPRLSEQRAIGEVLGALDDKIATNTKVAAAADEWVRARLAGLTASAKEAVSVSELVVNRKELAEPSTLDPASRYLGLEHLPRRSMWATSAGTAESVTSTKAQFQRGDILFGKLRPYFHKVVVAPFDGVCSTDILVLNPSNRELSGFALASVASDIVVERATAASEGTRMPRTSWKDLAAIEVPWPGVTEAKDFSARVSAVRSSVESLIGENQTLAETRDALLPQLMSGKLRVKDAEKVLENAGV